MIDKKTESDIKALKSFLEFWDKFHSVYTGMVARESISIEEESKYLETKDLIRVKYDALKGALEFTYMPKSRLTDPVEDILGVDNIRFMSEKMSKKSDGDWKDSYVFLNSILERLTSKKRRLEQFSPAGVFFKRFFEEGLEKFKEALK